MGKAFHFLIQKDYPFKVASLGASDPQGDRFVLLTGRIGTLACKLTEFSGSESALLAGGSGILDPVYTEPDAHGHDITN